MMDESDHLREAPRPRATRCQMLLALLFLVGVSALGWLIVGLILRGR